MAAVNPPGPAPTMTMRFGEDLGVLKRAQDSAVLATYKAEAVCSVD
jgi:hypothetical protein